MNTLEPNARELASRFYEAFDSGDIDGVLAVLAETSKPSTRGWALFMDTARFGSTSRPSNEQCSAAAGRRSRRSSAPISCKRAYPCRALWRGRVPVPRSPTVRGPRR